MPAFHLSIVIPAYNEENRINRTLQAVKDYYDSKPYSYDVLVVSDGSSDGTVLAARQFAETHSNFKVLDYTPNRGKGYAVRLGILKSIGDLILFMDADLATPLEETEKLINSIESGASVAIGSRPLKESNLEIHQPWYREMLGRGFNKAVQLLSVKGIQDTQCGFKLFTKEAAHDIFSRTKLDRFGFDFEALQTAADLGYKIDEIPIRWSHQEGSKVILMRDGPQMIKDLLKLKLKGKKWRLLVRQESL